MRSPRRADADLGRVWDALLDDAPPPQVDSADLATIQALYAIDDAPAPSPAELDAIWSVVVAETTGLQAAPAIAATAPGLRAKLGRLLRAIFVAALAGFIVGFIVAGGGARIVMRIIAIMSEDTAGIVTENEATPGVFTLGGTMAVMMQGALFGIGGGVAYAAIRKWLPADRLRHALVSAALFGLAGGAAALDRGENPDYERFGILGVNICLFSLLPVLCGLAIPFVWSRIDDVVSRKAASLRQGPAVGLLSLGMVVAMLPVAIMTLTLAILVPPFGLMLLTPLIEWAWRRWFGRAGQAAATSNQAWVRWAVVGAPAAVGLVLIIDSIRNLTSG